MLNRSEWMSRICRGLTFSMALNIAIIFIFIMPGFSFELSSDSITAGKSLTITGTGEPNSEHEFLSSFTMNLPVTSGRYSYETEIKIPNEPNSFTVTARNVKSLDAGVKLGIWITKSFVARGGVVYLRQDNIPSGKYKLRVSGNAVPGSDEIPITIEAETLVRSDSSGRYSLAIDTTGIPEGEYRIEGDGDIRIVHLGGQDKSRLPASYGDELLGTEKEKEKKMGTDENKSEAMGSLTPMKPEGERPVDKKAGEEETGSQSTHLEKGKGIIGMLEDWLKRF